MRFAHVRVAAVTLLSGSFLTLGVLGNAEAAPLATTNNTDTVCQALPASGTPTPSPSPSPSHSPSPSPSPSPSRPLTVALDELEQCVPESLRRGQYAADSVPAAGQRQRRTRPDELAVAIGIRVAVRDGQGHGHRHGHEQRQATSSATATTSASATSSASATTTSSTPATLAAHVAASSSSDPSPATSGSGSSSTTAPPELCVSVQRSQSSIKRGQTAGYVVQVSTKNGTASDVSVALTAQPSSQKPTFTSGCAKDDGTASCSLSSVTTKTTSLNAQIPVASNATSVSSVKLTATASVVTTTKWTPPAAAETTTVTAAAAPRRARAPPRRAPRSTWPCCRSGPSRR